MCPTGPNGMIVSRTLSFEGASVQGVRNVDRPMTRSRVPTVRITRMIEKTKTPLVSVHGGHSAEFCSHARDTLEEVVLTYIDLGFSWVGLTEHMPAVDDRLVHDEERSEGLDAAGMRTRFARYIATARALQRKYAPDIEILVGFETETCTGYQDFVRDLIDEFEPDYIVGSVHHVADTPIDVSKGMFEESVRWAGGVDELYCAYFDQQFEMVHALRPAVVGHFDLIRMFDPDYTERLERTRIRERVERNLQAIAQLDLILDFNGRAISKGQVEPYVAPTVLRRALELNIPVVPGDDSHGVESVGTYSREGGRILAEFGFDTNWRKPAR